ncbi:MAG: hypothetical protein OQJ89_13710 [Kangiellaceae bacterium]|nr:hypothetical protein [Kangiellaceae bacterium]
MSDLPATLTYFSSLQNVGHVLNRCALPVVEAHQLNDPFLPDKNTHMPFSVKELFDGSVKTIAHAILGKSPPRGQPNHPLQKAIMRWRMENRFNDESEIKEALQGLLPAMVEKSFNEAKESHQDWVNFISSKRLACLYEKFQTLDMWESLGLNHKGAAIKFRCAEDSIFQHCKPAVYKRIPATTVNEKEYVEYMIGSRPEIEVNPEASLLTQSYAKRQQKEWRLVVDNNEHAEQWLDFVPSLIQSVYLGIYVSEKVVEQLKSHLSKLNPQAHLYQAKCTDNEYSIEFVKLNETFELQEESSGDSETVTE